MSANGDRVIGFAFDGTGYGTDGAIWGGEVLVAGYGEFERVSHLRYVPLPGGDAAIRKPYRAALAHLWAAGVEWTPDLAPVGAASADELAVLRRQLERDVHCVPTSSMGRLFDVVSSLLGIRHVVSYEAQAAIELESAAAASHRRRAATYRFTCVGDEIDAAPVLRAVIADRRDGHDVGPIAAGFHVAVARLVAGIADRHPGQDRPRARGVERRRVPERAAGPTHRAPRSTALGFGVLTHHVVPPNDGGLALGQVAVAARPARAAATMMNGIETSSLADDLAAAALGAGAAVRGRGDDVVCFPPLAVARPARGGGVRPPGHRRQAGAASGARRGPRPRGSRRACWRGRAMSCSPSARPTTRTSDRCCNGHRRGDSRACGSAPARALRPAPPATCCGSTASTPIAPRGPATSSCSTTCCGSSPTSSSSIPACSTAAVPPCTDASCITCSDAATTAEVAAVHADGRAEVLANGLRESVDVSLVDPVMPGDLVLVHAGVALTVLPTSAGRPA